MALWCKSNTIPSSKKTIIIEIVCVYILYIYSCVGVMDRELTLELDRPGLKCLPRGSWVTLASSSPTAVWETSDGDVCHLPDNSCLLLPLIILFPLNNKMSC